ncbi:MAG: flagellar export chaperone FlgN [Deltaproteobacteria bacterium]|nr:flagellar export chaperone FlgN [Deltaproteobacteria bacterium]
MAALYQNETTEQIVKKLEIESRLLDDLLSLLDDERDMIIGIRDIELLETASQKQRLTEQLVSMREYRTGVKFSLSPSVLRVMKEIDYKTGLARKSLEKNRKLIQTLIVSLKGAVSLYQKALHGGGTYGPDGSENLLKRSSSRNQFWG